MVRWIRGVMVVLPVLLLLPALCGCTEPEPLYCDAEHPCTQAGYTCMYSRRTCIFKGGQDSGGDTGGGGADQLLPDTVGPDQGAPPDQGGDQSAGGGDAASGSDQ